MHLKNLFRRKVRTAITILAVAVSMSLLISMMSIAEGMMNYTENEVKKSKEDMTITSGGRIQEGHKLVDELVDMKEIESASAQLTDVLQISYYKTDEKGKSYYVNTTAIGVGVVPKDAFRYIPEDQLKYFPKYGIGGFSIGDDPHYENNYTGPWTGEIIIMGYADKNSRFYIPNGSVINVSGTQGGKTYQFRVVGHFSTSISGGAIGSIFGAVMHLSEMQEILGLGVQRNESGIKVIDAIDRVSVSLTKEVKEDMGLLKNFRKDLQKKYPHYSITTKMDRLEAMKERQTMVRGFYLAIASISMVIGLLFVACVMIMVVFERTNEIGMMRAIGISKKTIFVMILVESLLLVVIGAVLGILPGYFGAIYLSDYFTSRVGIDVEFITFSPEVVMRSLSATILIGTFVSLYPAFLATRVNIIKALNRVR